MAKSKPAKSTVDKRMNAVRYTEKTPSTAVRAAGKSRIKTR